MLVLCADYERETGGAFRVRRPGCGLDPCGVVKGWAVQRTADMLRAAGITEFCLDVGDDVAAGRPVCDLVSLTVVADDLTTADVVSTAAFALGVEGIAWADAQPGCLVYAVDAHHAVHRSTGLARMLK